MKHRIFLVGGTGGVGLCFLQRALDEGHNVKLYARNPDKNAISNANLEVIKGKLDDVDSMREGMKECDIVVLTAGVMSKKPDSTISQGAKRLIQAAEATGIKRFVAVTSLGLGDSWNQALLSFRYLIVPLFISGSFADKELEERYIMDSDLEWIIIRPARLLNKEPKYKYRYGMSKNIKGRVAREDVAHFMMTQLDDDRFVRKTPCIAD